MASSDILSAGSVPPRWFFHLFLRSDFSFVLRKILLLEAFALSVSLALYSPFDLFFSLLTFFWMNGQF